MGDGLRDALDPRSQAVIDGDTARPSGPAAPDDVLLDVRGLKTYFHVMDGTVKAVDGVDFSIGRGETLGLVGESGCGKSVTALSIMRLIETPPGEIVGGEIWFEGRDLLKLSDRRDAQEVRGDDIAMIFQEPMTLLNPVFTVGDQIAEAVRLHQHASARRRPGTGRSRSLRLVGHLGAGAAGQAVPPRDVRRHAPAGHDRDGPVCNPKLLIADEPTTALDVTIQAQILELIKRIQAETGTALLLITHDLAVVAETVQRRRGDVRRPDRRDGHGRGGPPPPEASLHPGAAELDPRASRSAASELTVIRASVPNPFRMPPGCKFEPRCPYAWEPLQAERAGAHPGRRSRSTGPLLAAGARGIGPPGDVRGLGRHHGERCRRLTSRAPRAWMTARWRP